MSSVVGWEKFARLLVSPNGSDRDPNKHAFSLLLAGGGFRGGQTNGETDEFSYRAAVNRVGVSDLHAK
ncbi:hypothetical protein LBMAG56_49040 [Verrucomicrobiota bacterium]|nr:hypothetical protein LBMAG56_49040 [Verrucomicrobiota bacterium]